MSFGLGEDHKMYIALEEAAAQLAKRRPDESLHQRVCNFLRQDLPNLPLQPLAFRYVPIATVQMADLAFTQQARDAGLRPYWLTHGRDMFSSLNQGKRSLLKIRTGTRERSYRTVNLAASMSRLDQDRTKLGEIKTLAVANGQRLSLAELHLMLRERVLSSELAQAQLNISTWLDRQAARRHCPDYSTRKARYFYPALLALAIQHGVLFERYDANDPFVVDTIAPAIRTVEAAIGVKPLIVQLENDESSLRYPAEVGTFLQQLQKVEPTPEEVSLKPGRRHEPDPCRGRDSWGW